MGCCRYEAKDERDTVLDFGGRLSYFGALSGDTPTLFDKNRSSDGQIIL